MRTAIGWWVPRGSPAALHRMRVGSDHAALRRRVEPRAVVHSEFVLREVQRSARVLIPMPGAARDPVREFSVTRTMSGAPKGHTAAKFSRGRSRCTRALVVCGGAGSSRRHYCRRVLVY